MCFMDLFKSEKKEELPTASSLFKEKIVTNEIKNNTCSQGIYKDCQIGLNNREKFHMTDHCHWLKELVDYDEDKDSFLIVDDNPGIISFLLDDIKDLPKEAIDLNDYNMLTFETVNAGYMFEATQHIHKGLNVKYAILDLTLGGSIITSNGSVKYTGVDIYQQILIYNPEVKVLFYTGNNLNEYIKTNKKLIDQFKEITDGKDIKDYILFKTSLDMNGRRDFLKEWVK